MRVNQKTHGVIMSGKSECQRGKVIRRSDLFVCDKGVNLSYARLPHGRGDAMKRALARHADRILIGLFVAVLAIAAGCATPFQVNHKSSPHVEYLVDVRNCQDDLFHVTVHTQGLLAENGIYHFAATAPGTYSILDFGRLVHSFRAFDEHGDGLSAERISTNDWKIADPVRLALITYDVEDSFDANLKENAIAPMSGSGIDSGFVGFNTFSVLGYFQGLQSNPVKMKVEYKAGWIIGTAMEVDNEGYYVAESYDRLADSPILIGDLTVATTRVNNIDVEVYMFAKDAALTAPRLLSLAEDILRSAGAFIGYSPVPYYKFLFCLLNDDVYRRNGLRSSGALEHSYSSFYVQPASERDLPRLKSTMAHEFMHIVTPLNLHSEIIQPYNFAVPTPSEHIWLYEGVTEWESNVMQFRSGLMTAEEFLRKLSQELRRSDSYKRDVSLSQMALEVYDPEIAGQYGNFYNRGAAVAALLDIRLLVLSGGTRGLREVLLELLERYGKDRPFPETRFFDVFVDVTYPEVRQFVDDYIRGTKPLPCGEYMKKLGFKYVLKKASTSERPTFGFGIAEAEGAIWATGISDEARVFGIRNGDRMLNMFGEELTPETVQGTVAKIDSMKVGDAYDLVVKRDGQTIEMHCRLLHRYVSHVFEPMAPLSESQRMLRQKWSTNLPASSRRSD